MSVKPNAGDTSGSKLDSNVALLTATAAATSSTAHGASISAKLDQAQRELVYHYLDNGRLTAANILATMT